MTILQPTEATPLTQLETYGRKPDDGSPPDPAPRSERSIVDIIEASAEEPKTVFRTASVLARLINDERVRVPHLMLSLTLTARGVERLANYNLNKDAIRRSAWAELVPSDPPNGSSSAPAFSENVAQIVRLAELKAQTERSEHMSVDDLVEIINTSPLRERYHRYWSPQHARPDPVTEILAIVSDLPARLDRTAASQDKQERAATRLKYLIRLTLALTSFATLFVVAVGATFLVRMFAP